MKIYSYVVTHDESFAPNPIGGYCTLACCKPDIRKTAEIGDWIIGTGSVNNYGNDKLVYAMKVTEKITFDEYYQDRRFKDRLDNIYFKNSKDIYEQIKKPKYHGTKKQMEHDLNSEFVLISKDYVYFGPKAIKIIDEMKWIIKKGPKHKSNFSEKQIQHFINWITPKVSQY
jgi:hypothetical protein